MSAKLFVGQKVVRVDYGLEITKSHLRHGVVVRFEKGRHKRNPKVYVQIDGKSKPYLFPAYQWRAE